MKEIKLNDLRNGERVSIIRVGDNLIIEDRKQTWERINLQHLREII